MKNNKLTTIASHSLSCSTISFSSIPRATNNGQHYRGIIESPAITLNNSINFVPSHIKTQSKSLSMIEISLNDEYPKSKVPLQPLQQLQPLDILMTSMEIENDEEITQKYRYCNELNSYLVDDQTSIQVLKTLNNILSHYHHDIDFKIDYNQKRIDGLVFISNYSVFFIIYIWEENKGNNNISKQTRFEFRRTSGDSLASAKFWAEIKGLYQKQIINDKGMDIDNNKDDNQYDFISLDLNLNNFGNNNNGHLSKTELDELTQCMITNDLFVVDELNFLYDSMVRNKNICFDILSHHEIMKQLINESLLNKDICVSRIVLLILYEISKIPNNNITNMAEFKLFNNINLLLNHQRELIKKYTVRLLSNLINNAWRIDDISRYEMIENIKKYENECTNNLNQEMINKINQKLMMQ